MTKEEVIEILERFVLGAKPCSQREIVDACASAYGMLKEQPSLSSNLDEAADEWEIFRRDVARDLLRDFCDRCGFGGNIFYEIGRIITYADELVRQLKPKEEEEK